MTRVLMVCVGNICRSALAERLLVARAAAQGIQVEVGSAGVDAVVGHPMDPTAAAELEALGGSAEGFTARQVTATMVAEADLVLAATKGVRARVLGFDPTAMRRTFTLNEFAALVPLVESEPDTPLADRLATAARLRPRVSKQDLDLRDPYKQSAAVHHEVAGQISTALDQILPFLR